MPGETLSDRGGAMPKAGPRPQVMVLKGKIIIKFLKCSGGGYPINADVGHLLAGWPKFSRDLC